MARVFKKRGDWWIDYSANGVRRREPVGVSHTLAKEVLAKRLAQVAEQKHFPGRVANARPFSEVAEKFWELHGKHLKQTGLKGMLDEIKSVLGAKRLASITAEDIQRHLNAVAARASNATANRQLTVLKSIFSKARAWGLYHGESPAASVRNKPVEAGRLRYLSHDELTDLIDKAHPRLYPLLMCALLTGMRRGEILGLNWENVSLERDVIYILKAKSGKPRELPIPAKLRDVLLTLGPKASGPVFDLPVIMLRRYFERALKDARIAGFRWHDLRHSFASHFIMRTNDLPALQTLLGHASPAMTLRYAHLSKGHLASELAAFESAIPVKTAVPVFGLAPNQAPSTLGAFVGAQKV